ncbi:MAG TPA: hypothetical protein VH092_30700 [Urbifossiella sp.]|nr:hypothetical protein [Urbifossiella sp.]
MPINFACACGKIFRVADEFAGKRTKCVACTAPLTVPGPTPSAEDDAFRMLQDAEAPDRSARPPQRDWDVPPRPLAPLPPPPPPSAARPAPLPAKKPRPARRPREESGGGFRIALSPAVAGGLGSMAVAVVWFVIGYEAGRIFIYPPIMFVLGLVAVVRGLFGAPEE